MQCLRLRKPVLLSSHRIWLIFTTTRLFWPSFFLILKNALVVNSIGCMHLKLLEFLPCHMLVATTVMKSHVLFFHQRNLHKTKIKHQNLVPLHGRISHSCWLLQAHRARKEVPGCFSLTDASSKVSNTFYSPKWFPIHSMMSRVVPQASYLT